MKRQYKYQLDKAIVAPYLDFEFVGDHKVTYFNFHELQTLD